MKKGDKEEVNLYATNALKKKRDIAKYKTMSVKLISVHAKLQDAYKSAQVPI